jgi:two-component system response regulator FixJ
MHKEIKRVFIIDDDESVGRALKYLLATFDVEVTVFLSAEKFFSEVPDSVQGCLILDIHMPGMDGWETLKQLIKSGSKRSVIIITADKNGGLREKALKIGALGFFQKPINGQELIYLINKAC